MRRPSFAKPTRWVRVTAVALFALLVAAGGAFVVDRSGASDERSQLADEDPLGLRALSKTTFNAETVALQRDPEEKYSHPIAKREKNAPKARRPAASSTQRPASGAPSDAEVKATLRGSGRGTRAGVADRTTLAADGTALAPWGAPTEISAIVSAANTIAHFPYVYGGGHGSFSDSAYDCSGSVSYALAAAGLVQEPLTSGRFLNWGLPGKGKWLTIYTNPGHIFMIVGGVRYDTSFRDGPRGSRWQEGPRSMKGFTARHWPGL